jgi:putative chitinase
VNNAAFFDAIRGGFTGRIEPGEVVGTEAILAAMAGLPLAFTAYALATCFHETAGTMQPISEYGGNSYFFKRYDPHGSRPDIARALGNAQAGDGILFHGRGYVQLTGRANYAKAGSALGLDMIASPRLALDVGVASKIMREGMLHGWFTGKRFASYLPSVGGALIDSYTQARRIINGLDRAKDIAHYALGYQDALVVAKWA